VLSTSFFNCQKLQIERNVHVIMDRSLPKPRSKSKWLQCCRCGWFCFSTLWRERYYSRI